MEKFEESLCVITGASAGIGKYLCAQLIQSSNLTVIGLSRRASDLNASNYKHIQCDIQDSDQIQKAFDEIKTSYPDKKISILINNAGLNQPYPLISDPKLKVIGVKEDYQNYQATADALHKMMNVNIVGLSLVTRLAVENMDHEKCGNIINISSECGHYVFPVPSIHFYTATKHALRGLTEGLRQEMRAIRSKIRVGMVSPGLVNTEFSAASNGEDPEFMGMMNALYESMALQPEDIWDTVEVMLNTHGRCEIGDILVRPTASMEQVLEDMKKN